MSGLVSRGREGRSRGRTHQSAPARRSPAACPRCVRGSRRRPTDRPTEGGRVCTSRERCWRVASGVRRESSWGMGVGASSVRVSRFGARPGRSQAGPRPAGGRCTCGGLAGGRAGRAGWPAGGFDGGRMAWPLASATATAAGIGSGTRGEPQGEAGGGAHHSPRAARVLNGGACVSRASRACAEVGAPRARAHARARACALACA